MNNFLKKTGIILIVSLSAFYIYQNSSKDKVSQNNDGRSKLEKTKWFPSFLLGKNNQDGLEKKDSQFVSEDLKETSVSRNTRTQAMLDSQMKRRQEDEKNDLLALRNSSKDFQNFSFALMRLSSQRHPEAKKKSLDMVKSPDRRLSHLSFRSLGYFDDPDVNNELKKLSRDQNPEIKRNALLALTWNPRLDSGRKKILENYLESIKDSSPITMSVIVALYRMEPDMEVKSDYSKKVEQMLNNSSSFPAEKLALSHTLLQMDPRNQVARDLVKKIEEEHKAKKAGR